MDVGGVAEKPVAILDFCQDEGVGFRVFREFLVQLKITAFVEVDAIILHRIDIASIISSLGDYLWDGPCAAATGYCEHGYN